MLGKRSYNTYDGESADAYHFFGGPYEGRVLTILWRKEIQVVSKMLYIDDRSRNTEPNMLLRTQLVLHSKGILNLPLWESVSAAPPRYLPSFLTFLSILILIHVLRSLLHHCLGFFLFVWSSATRLPRISPLGKMHRSPSLRKDRSTAFFRFPVLLELGWNVMEKKRII